MERIIDATAAASLPSPPALTGTTGYFTEGSPGVTPATRVRAWWANMIQEELLSLLTAAGITPDATATNFTQVLQAVRQLGRGTNFAVWKLVSGVQQVSLNGAAFTSTGATTLTPAYNGTGRLRLIGGGGGSGGAAGTGASAGGAAGSYGEAKVTLTSGTPITIGVGSGGVAAPSTTTDGTAGGASTFGAISAPGGNPSVHAVTGTGGIGGTTGGAVTGTGVVLSQSGMPGGNAGATGGNFIPGQGAGSVFGPGNYANTAPFTDNWGAGAGGGTVALGTGAGGTPGVVILEW